MPTSDPAGTPTIPAYGRDAARYDARTGRYEIYRRRVIDLLPLSDGDVVLDVGCGTGLAFERLLGRVGPAGTVVGVEPAAAMRTLAAQRVAAHGWTNVTLVGSPGGVGRAAGGRPCPLLRRAPRPATGPRHRQRPRARA